MKRGVAIDNDSIFVQDGATRRMSSFVPRITLGTLIEIERSVRERIEVRGSMSSRISMGCESKSPWMSGSCQEGGAMFRVRLLRLLNRSRREEDETVRVADVNALRTSIVLKLTGATGARQTASRKLVCWSESTAREERAGGEGRRDGGQRRSEGISKSAI